ncbi:MAG TPA: VWA domain-containing protein [Candidatus Saccharimonadales bacterium]|jgi:Ca-activated chloride channel family protein|nr:VWA domain-containing protein [Candidatus Saccharimonadales bacterium]
MPTTSTFPCLQRLASLIVLVCLVPVAMRSQSGAAGRDPQAPAVQNNDDQGGTIRVNVRLVNVFTTVTDGRGAPVAGLRQQDFRILEDGVPQTIRLFDKESEMPLSIVMAIDTSESTRRDLKLEVASAKKFSHSIVRPQDRLAIFQVSENIDQLTRFTADLRAIDRAIDRLDHGAGTSLYDAIYLAADALIDRQGRKVLVLITDGGDTTSKTTYNNALRRAQEAEAIVYSIIVVPVAADAGRNLGGEHALIQISKDTGGKYYYAESIEQLDQAFSQISEELRTQYLIAYYPNRRISASPFRKIQVEIDKKEPEAGQFKVRHRAGYFTAPAK